MKLPSVKELYSDRNFIYLQDNCPVHTDNIINEWLTVNNIETVPWPSYTPDLNLIENV